MRYTFHSVYECTANSNWHCSDHNSHIGKRFGPIICIIIVNTWRQPKSVYLIRLLLRGKQKQYCIPMATILCHRYVTACSFSPTSPLIATGSMDKTVNIWRVEDGHSGHGLSNTTSSLSWMFPLSLFAFSLSFSYLLCCITAGKAMAGKVYSNICSMKLYSFSSNSLFSSF